MNCTDCPSPRNCDIKPICVGIGGMAPRLMDRIPCRRCGEMVEKGLDVAEGCEDPYCPLTGET